MSNAASSLVSRIAAVLLVSLLFVACQNDEEKLGQFLQQGRDYVEQEKYNEAVIEFKNVLKIDPNQAEAHYELAKSYMVLKQGRDAYWELNESVRLDPLNIDARLSLGAIAMLAKDNEESLSQTNAVLEMEPENVRALVLSAKVLEILGRTEEAEERYLKAVEVEGDHASTMLVLAAFYTNLKRVEDAEPWYWKAAEAEPSFDTHTALGKFLLRDKERYAEASDAFTRARELAEEEDIQAGYQNLAAFYIATERGELGAATLEEGIEKVEDSTELIYMLARYYRSIGDDDRAEELIREASVANADEPEPALVLSAFLGRKGDLVGALEAAESALAADAEDVNARLRKAEILIDMGFRALSDRRTGGETVSDAAAAQEPQIVEGIEIVDAVLAEVPSLPEAHFVKGKALLAQGKRDEGVAALTSAVDGKPSWAEAHFVLGSALATTDDNSGARASLARAVEIDPQLVEARRLLAAIHQTLGEHEYAIEQGRQYLEARPDHTVTRVLVAQSLVRIGKRKQALTEIEKIPEEDRDAAVYFALGRMYLNKSETKQGREFLVKANELSPNNAKILRSIFEADRALENLDASKKLIREAAVAAPNDADIVQLLGMVSFVEGDLKGAEESFVRATELETEGLEAHQQLARFYQLTGRTDETIETYKKAIEVQPESAKLHHFLALLYESQGETDLARESYEQAIKFDSRHGHAKNNLAYLLAEEGKDLDRALDLAQDAKALMPNSSNAADTLGWVLYKRGVPSAAVGYLKEAVEGADPDEPALGVIRFHLAQAYEADGDTEAAVALLELNFDEQDRRAREASKAGRQLRPPPWDGEARALLDKLKSS